MSINKDKRAAAVVFKGLEGKRTVESHELKITLKLM